ncbi:IS66 family transposase [Deinococcus hopiensis]|uniref:IS66 family transposase n=1 Tax=Deinococcus hopiensis TaxID=309885 RepID=UPI00148387E0
MRQSLGRDLALRCQKRRDKARRFLHEEGVALGSNQAERDFRTVSVKRKISGGFRSVGGGKNVVTHHGNRPCSGELPWFFAVRTGVVADAPTLPAHPNPGPLLGSDGEFPLPSP